MKADREKSTDAMPVAALLAVAITAVVAQAPVIDLVKDPPKHDLNRKVHYHFGGRFGAPKPPLPLEVQVESVSPKPGRQLQVIVEISIRNNGPDAFRLPVGRDPDQALAPENKRRRECWFVVKRQGERFSSSVGPITFSSVDVPG